MIGPVTAEVVRHGAARDYRVLDHEAGMMCAMARTDCRPLGLLDGRYGIPEEVVEP